MTGAHARLDPAALLARYRRDGFVSLPGFLDRDELDALRGDLDRVLAETLPALPAEEAYFEDPGDPATLKQVQRLHGRDAELGDHLRSGPFYQLAKLLLQDRPAPQNLQYFDKPPGANQPTPPHQDGAYFPITPMNAVTIWLALEDVGPEQGCVRYLPGSHLRGMLPHAGSEILGFSRELEEPTAEETSAELAFPCAAGDVIAHHALTVHRAERNRSTVLHRRALGFIYYGATCAVDEAAAGVYQAALAARLEEAGRLRSAKA